MIKVSDLQAIAGSRSRSPMLAKIAKAFNKYAAQYGVTHQEDIADFLAHVSVETGGFRYMSENMNYSEQGLKDTFSFYRKNPKLAKAHARKPMLIANTVYDDKNRGKRFKLGNTQEGDGWRFRGSGAGQVTGRFNFQKFKDATGIDVISDPSLLREPDTGMKAALVLWQAWDMNRFAGGSSASRKKWNGGSHGLKQYKEAYALAMKRKLSVPAGEPEPMALSESESERIERLEEVAHDAAAVDRRPTTKYAAEVVGISSAIGTGSQVVEQVREAQSIWENVISASPWVLLTVVCIAGAVYIWKERDRKELDGKGALS